MPSSKPEFEALAGALRQIQWERTLTEAARSGGFAGRATCAYCTTPTEQGRVNCRSCGAPYAPRSLRG